MALLQDRLFRRALITVLLNLQNVPYSYFRQTILIYDRCLRSASGPVNTVALEGLLLRKAAYTDTPARAFTRCEAAPVANFLQERSVIKDV
jgi:hypothetical protein